MIDLIFSTSSKIKLQNMKIQIKLENISYELDSLDDLIDLDFIKLGSPPFLTLQQNTLCIVITPYSIHRHDRWSEWSSFIDWFPTLLCTHFLKSLMSRLLAGVDILWYMCKISNKYIYKSTIYHSSKAWFHRRYVRIGDDFYCISTITTALHH